MNCKHCTMERRRSGTLAWMAGEPFLNGNTKAAVEQRPDGGFELYAEYYDEWTEESAVTAVPVTHCPWCGAGL